MRLNNIWLNRLMMTFAVSYSAIHAVHAGNLTNYNEPNTQKLIQSLKNRDVHVVQFGDSHTAADHLTDVVRGRLQASLGDGGLGWGMPMYFSGQRLAEYGYDNVGWQPVSSRAQHQGNYTLGGLNAVPQYAGATLTIKSKRGDVGLQRVRVSVRQSQADAKLNGIDARGQRFSIDAPVKNNSWQVVEFNAQLPFTITAQQGHSAVIGGWWLENANAAGAIVSAIGINGAELSHWNRWNMQWQQELRQIAPQLVILSYGTNEAYNGRVDQAEMQRILTEKVNHIRQASPNTAVMIMSAPESLKNTAGQCGTRPSQLTAIQQAQRQVAQAKNTLFWDWQQAMGGNCSMKTWINQGNALNDGVHFSVKGYQKLGNSLAQDILSIANIAMSQSSVQRTNTAPTAMQINQPATLSLGYAKICLEGASECLSIGSTP